MKPQVFMSPQNGVLVVGHPLFTFHEAEALSMEDYNCSIFMHNQIPVAYAMDCGVLGMDMQLVSSQWVSDHLEYLGDL